WSSSTSASSQYSLILPISSSTLSSIVPPIYLTIHSIGSILPLLSRIAHLSAIYFLSLLSYTTGLLCPVFILHVNNNLKCFVLYSGKYRFTDFYRHPHFPVYFA